MTREQQSIITSAPVRLDFAGGWTDVAPFALEAHGVVVNAAIALRTRVELLPSQDRYRLRADDLDDEVEAPAVDAFVSDGKLELLKAAIRRYRPGPCTLRTAAGAPPGSGLGTSGALSVALVHALKIAEGTPLDTAAIAHEAWQLETVDAAVAGGQQDQYAAALGGFQELTFDRGTARAKSLAIEADFAEALAAHTVVCYTGRTRFSADTITRVMRAYSARDERVVSALHAMADLAGEMSLALLAADIAEVARLLTSNWRQQQLLDPCMCTDDMRRLECAMLDAGALGGKAAGAGAGGSMFFVVPGDVAPAHAAARAAGARILPVAWDYRGVSRD